MHFPMPEQSHLEIMTFYIKQKKKLKINFKAKNFFILNRINKKMYFWVYNT